MAAAVSSSAASEPVTGATPGKRPRGSSPSTSPLQVSTPKKPALGPKLASTHEAQSESESDDDDDLPRLVINEESTDSESHHQEQCEAETAPEPQRVSENPCLVNNRGRDENQLENDEGWINVESRSRRRRRHQDLPKFKLTTQGDRGAAYSTITALETDHPDLKMEVRPNLVGDYVLTPKDEASTVLLRRRAEEDDAVVLLDPTVKRHKVVLERYPLDLPLEAIEAHPHVLSATRLRGTRTRGPTRQVLVVYEGIPPEKLQLGCWGRYDVRPYQGEPVRCFQCHRFNHIRARCEHPVRCGVCSEAHPTERCIERHKAKEATTAKCPNCGKRHHAWNPQCPERLRRLPRHRPRQQQQQQQGPRGQPRQQSKPRFVPAPPPHRPAWATGPPPLRPTPTSQARPSEGQRRGEVTASHTPANPSTTVLAPNRPLPQRKRRPRPRHARAPHQDENVGAAPTTQPCVPAPRLNAPTPQSAARTPQPTVPTSQVAAPTSQPEAPTPQSGAPTTPADWSIPAQPLPGGNNPRQQEQQLLTIVSAIVERVAQVVRRLLERPEQTPTNQEELGALLRDEMLTAISGDGAMTTVLRRGGLHPAHPGTLCDHDGGAQ